MIHQLDSKNTQFSAMNLGSNKPQLNPIYANSLN